MIITLQLASSRTSHRRRPMDLTLTSVALVLLDQREGDALLQLGPLVSSFLGPSPHLSLSEACAFASTSLLDWMWSLSCTSVGRRASGWRLANYLRSEPHYYQWQFWKAMKVAAERGDLALVSWLFAHFKGCVVPLEVVEVAAKSGHLDVLQFLLEHDAGRYCRHKHTPMTKHTAIQAEDDEVSFHSVPEVESKRRGTGHVVHWGGRSIVLAIQNGYLAVGKWLYMNAPHALNGDEVKAAVEAALLEDELEIAEFFVPPGKTLLDYAKSYPRPGTIEKLLESGYLRESTECAAHAIRRLVRTERVDLMRRIIQLHSPAPALDSDKALEWGYHWFLAMRTACKHASLPAVRCLVEHPVGRQLHEEMQHGYGANLEHLFSIAAEAGQVEVMEFLFKMGDADQFKPALTGAVANGHLDAVIWILQHHDFTQHESVPPVTDEAARSGHLHILEFFYALQTSATPQNYFAGVAKSERKPILEHRAWWFCSTEAMDQAASHGHLAVVEWLHAHREPRVMGCSAKAMDGAASNGHLEVVQWLHAHRSEGCTSDAMDRAAENGHLEVVKWLHRNRSEGCTTRGMDGAAKNGHLEMLKWLHCNRGEGCTADALNAAVENSHTRVVWWLRYHYPDLIPSKENLWINGPNQFEMLLLLHELYPQKFGVGSSNRPMFGVLSEPNDEHVKEWIQDMYFGRGFLAAVVNPYG